MDPPWCFYRFGQMEKRDPDGGLSFGGREQRSGSSRSCPPLPPGFAADGGSLYAGADPHLFHSVCIGGHFLLVSLDLVGHGGADPGFSSLLPPPEIAESFPGLGRRSRRAVLALGNVLPQSRGSSENRSKAGRYGDNDEYGPAILEGAGGFSGGLLSFHAGVGYLADGGGFHPHGGGDS